ncbi:hypothetical protein FE257_001429 [Aspergillus nanangensis]|uniref:NAD-dependent epimerase/dehydratase domain-containing protein n=1 Tax=Aspergillus nanangensis TaxID=2582783 RepID=A0AAD4GPL7_ASPNN|nr:hypothetical protein FE257_001429 [Aspergillus nanangensis]
MIVVTGGAGFIGSNIVKALNQRNRKDLIVVDDMTAGDKFSNLVDCEIADYLDIEEFRNDIANDAIQPPPEVIFHNGACSSTTEMNGKYMLDANYTMSKELLHYCARNSVRLIYASSAAVYGTSSCPRSEAPLNIYGYSKMLFDRYTKTRAPPSQLVGLRYFNVYGPREQHKGPMASIVYQMYRQLRQDSVIKLFGAHAGYEAGMQKRDFVHVDDVVKVNLFFLDNPSCSGTFDVGKGQADTFFDLATEVQEFGGAPSGCLDFVPFPTHLKGRYQHFTCADISGLRQVGFRDEFKPIAQGVGEYLTWLEKQEPV